jgi:transcriptional regulator with XRE-family HTH domain
MGQETIGQRLRRLRLERGLSQRDLALPGVTNAYISRIEKGDRTPSVTAIRSLARRMGVSPEYLETGTPIPANERRRWEVANAELELRLGKDLRSAEKRLRAVLDESVDAGDVDAQLVARAALGLIAAHQGRHADAARQLEESIDWRTITPSSRPDVYGTLARAYAITDENQRAVELLQRCLEWLDEREPENSIGYIRFATYLSYALTDIGDYERARETIEDALSRSSEAADPYTRARLYWSQARLAAVEDDHVHAQAALRRAVGLLEALDDSLHLGRAHRLWAEISLDDGRPEDAEEHLRIAERLLSPTPEAKDQALFHIELGRLRVAEGNAAGAIAEAEQALVLAQDDVELRGRVEWMLATAQVSSGNPDAARNHYRLAAGCFSARSSYRRRLLREWADFLEREGAIDEAFAVLRQLVVDDRSGVRDAG